jgi:hypothetical protein
MSKLRTFRRAAERQSFAEIVSRDEISIREEARYIIQRAQHGEGCVVRLNELVFLSTATGDAWMLDTVDHFALCLARGGEAQPYMITETSTRFAIEWKADYRIDGDQFIVMDRSGGIRTILDYPISEIEARMN